MVQKTLSLLAPNLVSTDGGGEKRGNTDISKKRSSFLFTKKDKAVTYYASNPAREYACGKREGEKNRTINKRFLASSAKLSSRDSPTRRIIYNEVLKNN